MPLTSLTPTAAVKIGSTTVCFFEFFQFFCTVICFGKFLVDSFCQSKDLKNVNSDKLICINDTYRETVLLNSVQEFAEIEDLAVSDLFPKFTQSSNFYTFYCHILKTATREK